MLAVFRQNGMVESDSPKNRKKIYHQLKTDGVKWRTEVIGYTSGEGKSMCRWIGSSRKLGWDLERVVKWIREKRLLADDLKAACEVQYMNETFKFDDIKEVFNENPVFGSNRTLTGRERYALIEEKWGEPLGWIRYTPFDMCGLRKTIVRITRI